MHAHRAIYFARKGDATEAAADLLVIKSTSTTPNLSVTVLKNLAEAVLDFYCAGGNLALDRSLRAYSLASAWQMTDERALSAAWLSHFFDSDHDVRKAAKFAHEALTVAPPAAHDSRARAGLVVAQNLGIAGRPDLASAWYTSVLRHANADGDELNVSALIFNRTMERVSCWRQSTLQFRNTRSLPTETKVAAESASNFDSLVGNHGLENLNPLLLAQVHSLRGSYQQALDIYSGNLLRDDYAARMQADFFADYSLCLLRMGKRVEATRMMELALQRLVPETHPDDRAATHSRAAILYAEVGHANEASRHALIADDLWRTYCRVQHDMIELFSAIPVEEPSP